MATLDGSMVRVLVFRNTTECSRDNGCVHDNEQESVHRDIER